MAIVRAIIDYLKDLKYATFVCKHENTEWHKFSGGMERKSFCRDCKFYRSKN